VFLARTDTVFLVAIMGLALLAAPARTAGLVPALRPGMRYALGCALLVLRYFAVNYAVFGAILPVSGTRKITFGVHIMTGLPRTVSRFLAFWNGRLAYFSSLSLELIHLLEILAVASLALVLVWLAWRDRLTVTSTRLRALAPFHLAAAVHYWFIATFMPGEASTSF
jgi:hypothetical protein